MSQIIDQLRNQIDWEPPSDDSFPSAIGTTVLGIGVIYMAAALFRGDIANVILFAIGWVVLFLLVNVTQVQRVCLPQQGFTLRHVLHTGLYWIYSAAALVCVQIVLVTDAAGKDSRLFYVFLLVFIALAWSSVRSLLIMTRPGAYEFYSTRIPLWEQTLLAGNELVSIALVTYIWSSVLVRIFQPDVFTTRLNIPYSVGLGVATLVYYIGLQLMWVQAWNNWISRHDVWVRFARFVSPFILLVTTILVASRFTQQTDPRTATLVENAELNFAALSLVPVIWMLVFVVMVLVYTGRRGLRQRFLPDSILDYLPNRLAVLIRAISDMDMLLVVGLLTTFIPVYLLFFGGEGQVITSLRQTIEQRGSVFIETSEQALAILFVLPFYTLILILLFIYAIVVSRPSLSARERNEMMDQLPVGFLISGVIILYMFAIPFTQVFIEGRLPTLSRDLGRILSLYILVPLILLYLHFLPLVRFPYGRGQGRWREQEAQRLEANLRDIDRRIRNLNTELTRMDNKWNLTSQRGNDAAALRGRLDTLHRYIHLNSERDDLNMQRLQIVSSRQELAEISDTPFSVTVARLPLRILSIGIPVLLLFQLYQWAVVSDGLQQVINNPNLTLAEFIQILLENIEF
ncbi:MAG: hypothetical protein AAF125_08815 [Chloroflexota bacterium]